MDGVFVLCAGMLAGALAVQGLWHVIASVIDSRRRIVLDRAALFGTDAKTFDKRITPP